MEVNTEVEAVHEIGHLTVSHRPRLTTRRNKILNSKVLFERCDVQKSEILTTGCVSKIKYQGSCWCVLLFFSPFHDMLVGIYYSYKVSIFSIVCFSFFLYILYYMQYVWCGPVYHGGCGGLGGEGGGLAGHQGRQLLDADRLLGVQKIVHAEWVFARRFCRWWSFRFVNCVRALLLGAGGWWWVLAVPERRWLPRFRDSFTELIENTNRPVLPNSVAHLQGINPHCKFTGEGWMQECGGQSTTISSLANHRVHFAIDSNAPVARTLKWLLWKPMVAIPTSQHFD